MSFSQAQLNRLYWHSRRGMLELDLMLVPFAQNTLPDLNEAEQMAYQLLLAEEDQDLFLWLTGREETWVPELKSIVELVRTSSRSVSK